MIPWILVIASGACCATIAVTIHIRRKAGIPVDGGPWLLLVAVLMFSINLYIALRA